MAASKNKWLQRFSAPWIKFVLTGLAFTIWLGFFDKNSLLLQNKLNQEILELEEKHAALSAEREVYEGRLAELQEDPARFAREKYYMHQPEELVFILD